MEGVQLKHYRQNNSECGLVAPCMAFDKDYRLQSHKFEVTYGKTWIEALSKRATSYQCVAFVRELTGGEPLWFAATDRWKTPGRIIRPPLNGRGILTIDCGPSKNRHAVAWSHGEIYDGNAPGPLPWHYWMTLYPGAWLDGWHRVERLEK